MSNWTAPLWTLLGVLDGIFAMGFGVGVVTGIVLSFEFGLGFAKFAQIAGPAIGPMIGVEVLTAFFLEAGFFGDYALWAASCRSQASLLRYLHGGARH